MEDFNLETGLNNSYDMETYSFNVNNAGTPLAIWGASSFLTPDITPAPFMNHVDEVIEQLLTHIYPDYMFNKEQVFALWEGRWHEIKCNLVSIRDIRNHVQACNIDTTIFPQMSAPVQYGDQSVLFLDCDYHAKTKESELALREAMSWLKELGAIVQRSSNNGVYAWFFFNKAIPTLRLREVTTLIDNHLHHTVDITSVGRMKNGKFIGKVRYYPIPCYHPKGNTSSMEADRLEKQFSREYKYIVLDIKELEAYIDLYTYDEDEPSGNSSEFTQSEDDDQPVKSYKLTNKMLHQINSDSSDGPTSNNYDCSTIGKGEFNHEVFNHHAIPRTVTPATVEQWVRSVSKSVTEDVVRDRIKRAMWVVKSWKDNGGKRLVTPQMMRKIDGYVSAKILPWTGKMDKAIYDEYVTIISCVIVACHYRSCIDQQFVMTIKHLMRITGFLRHHNDWTYNHCQTQFWRNVIQRLVKAGVLELAGKAWLYSQQRWVMNVWKLNLDEELEEILVTIQPVDGKKHDTYIIDAGKDEWVDLHTGEILPIYIPEKKVATVERC
jgi:hypothetical protein